MSLAMHFPGPRDGLDEGSLAELAQDSREVEIGVSAPLLRNAERTSTQQGAWPSVSSAGPIDVPEQATALIDGLAAYGACS